MSTLHTIYSACDFFSVFCTICHNHHGAGLAYWFGGFPFLPLNCGLCFGALRLAWSIGRVIRLLRGFGSVRDLRKLVCQFTFGISGGCFLPGAGKSTPCIC